jgi:hypothetical protein
MWGMRRLMVGSQDVTCTWELTSLSYVAFVFA